MLKKQSTRYSFISSLFGFSSSRSAGSEGPGRLQLFGMSGTFGHGVEKHLDNWELGEPAPDRVTLRKSMGDLARQRRAEASERLGEQKMKGFNDFHNR